MRKKLIRKKIKICTSIIFIFLLISLVVSGIYIYITYQSEKDLFYQAASNRYSDLMSNINSSYALSDWELYNIYNTNRVENSEFIVIKDGYAKNYVNYFVMDFVDEENSDIYCCIYYDKFKSFFTDKQYEEITAYLQSTNEKEDKEYYQLVCTECYVDLDTANDYNQIKPIYPKKVEIVLVEANSDWTEKGKTIKTYEISYYHPPGYELVKSGDMHRNQIDTDFALGKYDDINLISDIYNYLGESWNSKQSEGMFQVDAFNLIYYKYSVNYTLPDGVTDNSKAHNSDYGKTEYQYVEKINIFKNCIDRIGLMFIYTVILFLMAGTIVAVMSWSAVKKQILLEEKRRNMINSMAHDLKTPLFIISGYAENLLECVKNEEETVFAKAIVEQTNAMNRKVYTMLDVSKLNIENYCLNMQRFSMSDFVSDILLQYNEFYEDFTIGFVNACWVDITADKNLLECVIRNFIDNAIKYTDDKNSINILIDNREFSISNSISKDADIDIKHIWDPDKREKYMSGTGNGLGLSLAKSVLRIHKFWYHAKITDNTITFSFCFGD